MARVLKFPCPCGATLVCASKKQGKYLECGTCGRLVHAARLRREPSGPMLRQNCPECGKRFSVEIGHMGAVVICPGCEKEVVAAEVAEAEEQEPSPAPVREQTPEPAQEAIEEEGGSSDILAAAHEDDLPE